MRRINISALTRDNVKLLKPYSSARDDFKGTGSIFLDANESPFATGYNRYPDPHQHLLKNSIAGLRGVKPGQIFLGNGSDEAIDLLFRTFCEPGRDNVIIPQPTYGMYSVSAAINNIHIVSPHLTALFDLQSSELMNVISPVTKLIFLCSPNNPSGNLLSTAEIEIVLNNFSGLVVIDEAYIDFSGSPGWITRLGEFQNLVVLQTFSKAWGLAGLRLGICFADPGVISMLNKIKPPYNINAFTQSEVLKSIELGVVQKNKWVDEIKNQRSTVVDKLRGIKCIRKIFPSDANFILVEMEDAIKAYNHLVKEGIIVRDRSNVIQCENCLRMTIGTREENIRLVEALNIL